MRYLDVCAGISASTVAWKPLGWEAAAYSEIDAAPRAVLAHHYPDTPLHGDFTTIRGDEYGAIDLLVGGTPCQDFSVAGLRAGLDGDRGNLSLEFLRLADRTRPRWVVWENVPGVLSIDEGRAFGAILGGLGELGYGFAYRVLDAQFFGVPQRRRRVFVVGCLGDWRSAAAVLSERHSLSGHPAPRRQKGQVAPTIPSRSLGGGGLGTDFDCDGGLIASAGDVAHCLNSGGMGRQDYETETMVIMERGRDGTPNLEWRADGTANAILTPNGGRGGLGVGAICSPIAFSIMPMNSGKDYKARETDVAQPIMAGGPVGGNQGGDYIAQPVAFDCKASGQNGFGVGDIMSTLRSMGHKNSHSNAGGHASVQYGSAVRRLTPRECERLQGFPDDYTLVPHRGKPMADGPRYKALGNSMAVPVMRWIGERIAAVDALHTIPREIAA